MKKETNGKKSKLWLIIAIAVVAVLAIAGVVLALVLGGGEAEQPEVIESKLYWNVDREEMIDKETMLTKRKPAADGLYYIRFAVDGEQVELPCADKKLVNKIDFQDVVGLKFDADGIIVDMYKAADFANVIVENAYVQSVNGGKVTTNSSMTLNGMEVDVDMTNANVYIVEDPRPEVPGRDFTVGAKDEVKLMDTVIAFGDEEGNAHTVFIVDRLYDSKVYWRYSAQEFDSTNKVSSRKLADDGYWYMDFLCDGEIVTVRTADQACINAMDGYGIVSCACGLVFDKNGDVVDVFNAGLAVKGSVAANNYDVTAIDGNMVTLTRKLAGTEQGRTYMLNVTEDLVIRNVTTTADKFGEITDLQIGDRVYLLADSTGKPVQAYVTCRLVDSPMYYNVSVSYNSTTKETNRKPDADGWYTITLAVKGKQKDFRCKDKAIMTQIDAYGNKVFGLKVRGDVIVKAYNPECVTGAYSFAANNWVVSLGGGIVGTVNASGTAVNGIMDDACEVYDVSGCSEFIGAKTTLQEGDRILAYNTPDATMRYIYVISRKVDGVSLYWNFEKKYDAVKQQTTRTPDADGYYVFKMAKCGSAGEKLMKTKDIELASKIDKTGVYALCLKTKGDIIQKVYPATAINAGYSRIYGIYVTGKNDDTHYGAMFYTTGATANIDISEAKIYNVSGVYKKGAGENTTLQAGDRLMLLYGQSGKSEHIIVFERECGSSAYFQFNPNFNSSAKTTLPDENGYYNYTVTSQGKVQNVKTKDAAIAAYVDARTLAFGLKLKGDIIVGAYSAISTKEIAASAQSYYDVTKISGNKITLERTVPGSSNTGDIQEIDISKAKVYNVSAYAGDAWGKTAKLGIGDRVQTYKNEKNEITLVYIIWENTREAGHKSYCEHCKQEVFWHPYYGTIDFIDKHYYLPADYSQYYSKGWGIQGRASGWDWVLDLNGHTYAATGSYAFAVRGNSTLTIVDTSKAKTGRVTGIGVQVQVQVENADGTKTNVKSQYQSSQAGIFQVLDGGVLNLRGGTYTRTVDREITNLRRAGVAMVNKDGTLNIYDGAKLVNNTMDVPLDLTASEPHVEIRRAPQGGAIYNNGGVVNIYGGEISNNGKIHDDFKEFASAVGNGGNIFQSGGELNIYGGKITGGWCVGNGGNLYVSGGKVNVYGGEISGGTSVNAAANNIILAPDKGIEMNVTGGKISGDITVSSGNTLKISGNPVISMGDEQGLFLGEGVKAEIGTLKSGAKITISSTGVFTTDFASADAAKAAMAYFAPADKEVPLTVVGKALAYGKAKCLNGHTNLTQCHTQNCHAEMIYWTPWKSDNSLPTEGNYYLTKDVVVDASVTAGNLRLDLNGFNITRKVTAEQVDEGETTYIYKVDASKKTVIADLSGNTPGTVKIDCEEGVILNTSYGFIYLATGGEMEIYGGVFDGRNLTTDSVNAGGIICGGGALTINGGEFYGWSNLVGANEGIGSIFGGWSTSVLTINNGTFYGGTVKQGGMFASTGKIVIHGGLFDGNNTAGNGAVDPEKPRTVATHGGLILVQNNVNASLEITGGTFKAGQGGNSGGMIYVEENKASVVTITGGTFQASSKAQKGGFIRFRGKDLNISGVKLEGFAVSVAGNADIVSFEGFGTLTIGKGAEINGGIMVLTKANVVLKDDVKINKGTNCALSLAAGATLDLNGLNEQAKVYVNYDNVDAALAVLADEATAKKLVDNKIVELADNNYALLADGNKLKVKLVGIPGYGKIVLQDNVVLNETVVVTGDLEIDLNGFNIIRNVTEQQIANGEKTQVFYVNGGKKLTIKDTSTGTPGTVKAVLPKDADQNVIPVTSSAGIISIQTGATVEIYNGIFDGREIISSTVASGGIFCGDNLTIHGGTFYGMSNAAGANAGNGTIYGGWSTATLTINGGTFYGGTVKQGGMFASTGKIVINDGLFDGNNSASNTAVDPEKPRTVATHGGLILVQNNVNASLTINGGTFKAGQGHNSGGMIYVEANNKIVVNIKGGTFQASSKAQNGGFIRFRGKDLNISGVKLEGFAVSVAANADIVSFEGFGTLTIGKDAEINGGIMVKSGALVLKDNVKINRGATYSIKLSAGVAMDLNGLSNDAKIYIKHTEPGVAFAELADAATAETLVNNNVVESADDNYIVIADGNKLTVKVNDGWENWTSDNSLPTSGKYRLTKNVTISETCVLSGDLEIDLKGYSITRNLTEDQITGGAKTQVFYINASQKLTISDTSSGTPGTVKVVLPKDADDKTIPVTSAAGIISIQTGGSAEINNGIFDGREIISSTTATGGIFCGDSLTINGGIFYGMSNAAGANAGNGTIYGGWSTSTLTINDGTFYGGTVKQGGMFASTGKIVINNGLFDGNNSASNTAVDASKPRTVATHGGLILVQNNNNAALTINGGTFKAGQGYNSGGIIYVEANSKIVVNIKGGTFQASSKAQNGGFIRFRGKDLNISGVKLEGFAVTVAGNADIVSFEGSGALTIGKDTEINGGIMIKSGTGVVLKDNVKINAGTNCGLSLGTATMDISNLGTDAKVNVNWNDTTKAFAEAADEETAKALVDGKVIVSADPNFKVIADGKNLTVKVQIQWNEWNAAAAATMYGGAEADNLHLTKLPTAGDYKLIADVTIDARVAMTGNVNLNLNGFTATRVIKSGAADGGFYTTNAKGNLYITDEIKDTNPEATVGTMKTVMDTGVTSVALTGALGYVGAGYTMTIDEGNFDFRGVKTTASATTGCGAIIVDGTLTINGGTFYGTNAGTTGFGTVIGGRSANVITINGGTFYGNNAKQGGIISTTGNLTINGGLFDGNTNASNGKVNADLPQSVATHGGLFYVAKALTITGGEFKAGRVSGSGGIAYVTGSGSIVSGGTYTAGGQTNYAGFFRFDGSATISGVTLSGGKATTNGNNIAFGSNGNATLTIGQDAVIDGGIMFRNDKTGNKLVLVGNAQVNGGTGAAYSLNLANATVHIGDVANAAVATVGSTFTNYIATYDADGNVTGVTAN